MKRNTKIFCAALALVLVFGAVVGGTLAYLIGVTGTVKNTFTVGNVTIDLTETINGQPVSATENLTIGNNYKMIPGAVLDKDPTVTVKANSEDCYLFVKVKKSADFDTYIKCDMNITDWKTLDFTFDDGSTVYYQIVETKNVDQKFNIIGYTDNNSQFVEDKVVVKENITNDMMKGIDDLELTFTAYAIQKDNIPVVEGQKPEITAWDTLNA